MIWQSRVQYLTEAGNYFSRNIVCMFSFLLLIIILRYDINSFVWLRVYFNIVHIKSMEHRRIEQALIFVYNSIIITRHRTTFGKYFYCEAMVTAYGAILRLFFQDRPHLICHILSRTRLANNGTMYQTK